MYERTAAIDSDCAREVRRYGLVVPSGGNVHAYAMR